jgi:hypothetical protein
LERTDAPKNELIEMFKGPKKSQAAFEEAKEFGDQVYHLLCSIGKDNKVFRILVV